MIAMRIVLEDTATPALERVRGFLQSEQAQQVIGYAGRNVVREHLQDLEDTRSGASGGPATHYYGSARRSTSYYIVSDTAVEINVAQVGMRLHYYGGTVEAGKGISSATGKPTQYLTIPARSEAYGKKASDFDDLIVLWGRNGPYALARAISTQIGIERSEAGEKLWGKYYGAKATSKGQQGGEVMFWLTKSATIKPDPSVMPDSEEFRDAITTRLGSVIRRRFHGETSAAGQLSSGDEGEGELSG